VALKDRVSRLEARHPPPEDRRFYVWRPEDQPAWATVSHAEKVRLFAIYQRCGGGPNGPAMVRRREDGTWKVTELNLPIGSTLYGVGAAMKRLGFGTFIEWVSREGTEAEIEVMARLIGAGWDLEAVEPGDGEVLEGLLARVPERSS
jgi:hypothetical protein